jgi:hypothetical protein
VGTSGAASAERGRAFDSSNLLDQAWDLDAGEVIGDWWPVAIMALPIFGGADIEHDKGMTAALTRPTPRRPWVGRSRPRERDAAIP